MMLLYYVYAESSSRYTCTYIVIPFQLVSGFNLLQQLLLFLFVFQSDFLLAVALKDFL